MSRPSIAVLIGTAASLLCAPAAWAACDVAFLSGGPALGTVVKGTVDTSFTLPVGGPPVTQAPLASAVGAAILLHPSAVSNDPIQVQITGTGSNKGSGCLITLRAGNTSFPVTSYAVSAGTGVSGSLPATVAANGQFTLMFSGNGSTVVATFKLGPVLKLPGTASAGAASWPITVDAN
ncbi:MAG: hypothetical protein ACXWKY_09960 [Caulobacteraceae bacterium]